MGVDVALLRRRAPKVKQRPGRTEDRIGRGHRHGGDIAVGHRGARPSLAAQQIPVRRPADSRRRRGNRGEALSRQCPTPAGMTTTSPAAIFSSRPSGAAHQHPGLARGDAEHLVRGRMVMVIGEDRGAPARRPAAFRQQRLHRLGAGFGTRPPPPA